MPTIYILVEHNDGWYTATASEECGQVGGACRANVRAEAVKRAKIQADRLMGTACRFVEQDLTSGGEG